MNLKVVSVKGTPEEGKLHVIIWRGFGNTRFFLKVIHENLVDGTKPEYVWNGFHYTLDTAYCGKFDKQKNPILDFEKNHSIPIRLVIAKSELPEKDSSQVFNELFNLGILKAIIASATRLKADSPVWLPIIAGMGIGFIVAVVMGHFGLLGSLTTGNNSAGIGGVGH